MLEQAVPIALGRLKLRGRRGSVYRCRFYRLTVDQLAGPAVKPVLDGCDISLYLLGCQAFIRVGLLDFVLARNQQHGKFEIRGWLRLTHLRNRALPVVTKIAKKRANDFLAQRITRAARSSGRVA